MFDRTHRKKVILDNFVKGTEYFLGVGSEILRDIFKERGGFPFEEHHVWNSFFRVTFLKLPKDYPKSKSKTAVKQWKLSIPALAPDTELSFDELDYMEDIVKLTEFCTSRMVIVTQAMLAKNYDNLHQSHQSIDDVFDDTKRVEQSVKDSESEGGLKDENTAAGKRKSGNISLSSPSDSQFFSPLLAGSTESMVLMKEISKEETELASLTNKKSPALSTRSKVGKINLMKENGDSFELDVNGEQRLTFDYSTEDECTKSAFSKQMMPEDEEELRSSVIEGVDMVIEKAYYDKQSLKWVTKLTKRILPPADPVY